MDADKEIDVWTTMEIRKADKLRSHRLELYVYRVKNNLDVFTGKKIEGELR